MERSVLRQGYLALRKRKGDEIRFFVLYGDRLDYYKGEADFFAGEDVRGRLSARDIDDCTLVDGIIRVRLGQSRDVLLVPQSADDVQHWMGLLQQVVHESHGQAGNDASSETDRPMSRGSIAQEGTEKIAKGHIDEPSGDDQALCEGILHVEKKNELAQRYFVLYGDRLDYYESAEHKSEGKEPKGYVVLTDIDRFEERDPMDTRAGFSLHVSVLKKPMNFVTVLDEDHSKWLTAWGVVLSNRLGESFVVRQTVHSDRSSAPAESSAAGESQRDTRTQQEMVDELEASPVHQGALEFQRKGSKENRFFTLFRDRLDYYKTEDAYVSGEEPRGTIALQDIQRVTTRGCEISIEVGEVMLEFCAPSSTDLQLWCNALQSVDVALDKLEATPEAEPELSAKLDVEEESVSLVLTVHNVDYSKLMASKKLLASFEASMREAMVAEVGLVIAPEHVDVRVMRAFPGSVAVRFLLTLPPEVGAGAVRSKLISAAGLAASMAHRIDRIDTIDSVSIGSIKVSAIQFGHTTAAKMERVEMKAKQERELQKEPEKQDVVEEKEKAKDEADDSTLLFEGPLLVKRGDDFVLRYFAAYSDRLDYHRNGTDRALGKDVTGCILLADVERFEEEDGGFSMTIVDIAQPMRFKTQNSQEQESWLATWQELLAKPLGEAFVLRRGALPEAFDTPLWKGALGTLKKGLGLDSRYWVLFGDRFEYFVERDAFLRKAECRGQIYFDEVEDCEVCESDGAERPAALRIQVAGKMLELRASQWDELKRCGEACEKALSAYAALHPDPFLLCDSVRWIRRVAAASPVLQDVCGDQASTASPLLEDIFVIESVECTALKTVRLFKTRMEYFSAGPKAEDEIELVASIMLQEIQDVEVLADGFCMLLQGRGRLVLYGASHPAFPSDRSRPDMEQWTAAIGRLAEGQAALERRIPPQSTPLPSRITPPGTIASQSTRGLRASRSALLASAEAQGGQSLHGVKPSASTGAVLAPSRHDSASGGDMSPSAELPQSSSLIWEGEPGLALTTCHASASSDMRRRASAAPVPEVSVIEYEFEAPSSIPLLSFKVQFLHALTLAGIETNALSTSVTGGARGLVVSVSGPLPSVQALSRIPASSISVCGYPAALLSPSLERRVPLPGSPKRQSSPGWGDSVANAPDEHQPRRASAPCPRALQVPSRSRPRSVTPPRSRSTTPTPRGTRGTTTPRQVPRVANIIPERRRSRTPEPRTVAKVDHTDVSQRRSSEKGFQHFASSQSLTEVCVKPYEREAPLSRKEPGVTEKVTGAQRVIPSSSIVAGSAWLKITQDSSPVQARGPRQSDASGTLTGKVNERIAARSPVQTGRTPCTQKITESDRCSISRRASEPITAKVTSSIAAWDMGTHC